LILANEDLKEQYEKADEGIVRAQAVAKEFSPTFVLANALTATGIECIRSEFRSREPQVREMHVAFVPQIYVYNDQCLSENVANLENYKLP
jgi:hypothetical protein